MIWRDLEKMAYKSALAVVLLLCVTAAIEARFSRISLGSGNLRSSGWFGKKQTFCYGVPRNVYHVSLRYNDMSSSGSSIGSGNGGATLSWRSGSRRACVRAWVNGKWRGSNHVSWTVWAWYRYSGWGDGLLISEIE